MNKFTYLLLCLFLGIGVATAQTTSVTGIVISADDGEPVIGASVIVKGTTTGTVTDLDGNFTINNVPSSAKTLVISYVGMQPQEVSIQSGRIRVTMQPTAQALEEVVVTAMGIKRSEKSIGYSATAVNSEQITQQQTGDIMSGLAGKIAGVQISSTSSDPGASNSVVIRGMSSLSGSNQPLYVVDGVPLNNYSESSTDQLNKSFDFGNGANAINPNDVASMTVLKGAAATALYGSRAANGVILITTKAGTKQKGYGIEYNGGVQFERVLRLPELQNDFGIGWYGDYTMIENGSWGPRFDGSMQLWGSVYENSQKMKPYVAQKNNVKDFFDTGFRYTNSVSFNGATDKADYYASFSHLSNNGIIPTTADKFDKYTFSMRGSYTIDKLTLSSSMNYTTQKNNFATTGQGTTSMINSIYQMPRDISIIGLKDLNDPFNTPDYYYTPYGVTNPYYILENSVNNYYADKIFGKFQADLEIIPGLTATYRLGLDATNSENKIGMPELIYTPNSPHYGINETQGFVRKEMVRQRELNHDMLLVYDKSFNDFHLNALAGMNVNERTFSRLRSDINGLDIATWYNLMNSPNSASTSEYQYKRRLIGLFAQAEVGYKSLAFVTLTARNDWSSTLPQNNRSFFYPGITGSLVFTELMPEASRNILTFGKARIAWGQTGNDADVYMVNPYLRQSQARIPFGYVSFPLNGMNAFSVDDTLGNPTLSPEITSEFEVGANLIFFNGRFSVDGSYYNRQSNKQIFGLDMDPASGYRYQNTNLGKISNKGVELLINVVPVQTRDFKWDITWNFTKNNNKVHSLPEEIGGETSIWAFSSGIGMYAVTGQPLGVFKAEVPLYDTDGNIVVNEETGLPMPNPELQIIGNINYKYEMGIGTTVSYKGVTLGVDFDIRRGGKMYSRTKDINYFVGNAIQTTYNDRNTFIVPGSVNPIYNDDQEIVGYKENTTAISSADIFTYWDNGGIDMGSAYMIDKSYVKLRSIVVGWDLPNSWLRDTFLQSARVSFFGNNLFVWTPSSNTFIDPEVTSFGNDLEGRFGEYTANPSTRKFGFNVMVKF